MQEFVVKQHAGKEEKYRIVLPQIRSMLEGEDDLIANLANIAAALHQTFGFLWVGFYRLVGEQLILGPFQGPIACTRIALSAGVCGASAREGKTLIVPDVEQFPGHIACSSLSRSEIVVPLVQNGEVKLLLDVDSENPNAFDSLDQHGLESVIGLIDEKYPAPHPLMPLTHR